MADTRQRRTLVLTDLREVVRHLRSQGFSSEHPGYGGMVATSVVRILRALEPSHFLAVVAGAPPGSPLGEDHAAAARAVESMGLRVDVCADECDAASLLAHIASQSLHRGFRPAVLSRTPQLLALLCAGAEICDPVTMRWVSIHDVQTEHGVEPDLVVDSLALQAANGIGPKIAASLLRRHGTAELALAAVTAAVQDRRSHASLLLADFEAVRAALREMTLRPVVTTVSPKDMEIQPGARAAFERLRPGREPGLAL